MKITLNWLKQYVEFEWSPEELAERLTMLGVEVEGVVKTGGEFEGVVVAEVLAKDKHPNADKLALCRVHDGKVERQIVCGAHNYQPGDKVPLILPGASLPAKAGEPPVTIKAGKIRGVESQGMMCSPQELGLPDQVDGILVLRRDAPAGQPFAEYLGRAGADVVYDLEITPNRPDLNSVIGIAREISALTGNGLKVPEISVAETGRPVSELVAVEIQDPELCGRYTARVITGVKVGPSPEWLRATLEKVGIRSINNVVDVTNFVMLEVGQPLHAFDYHLVGKGPKGPTIVVRRASAREVFVTLDGQERKLEDWMLLIADPAKAVALAGVMGGQNSEINPDTVDVLIESAWFKPQSIRATSKRLELRTESSYRFERGADVGICDWASRRAAQLIVETAGGSLASGVVDAYPAPAQAKQITLRPARANQVLGLQLGAVEIERYLTSLELKAAARKPRPVDAGPVEEEALSFRIPTFRVDLKREIDLIEEVARLYGVDRIPATPPRGALGRNEYDAVHDDLAQARQIMAGLGLNEAQGQTLISDTAARLATAEPLVELANPLSSDMNVLRPSLIPGLLDSLRNNLSYKTYDVGLFELGRVFLPAGGEPNAKPGAPAQSAPCREQRRLAVAMTGNRDPVFWTGPDREAKTDIYDLKGVLEEFFEAFGLRGVSYTRRSEATDLWAESATIHLGKLVIGELGQVMPTLARKYDLRDAVFVAELNLDQVLARRSAERKFKALPAFPSIRRDIAMLLPEAVTHEEVLQVVRQTKPENLESVELFDIFRGKNVPAGQKSMAYAFTFRNPERSLTDAEASGAFEKLVSQFKARLGAAVRE